MATGIQTSLSKRGITFRLAENVNASGLAAPTAATDGFDLSTLEAGYLFPEYAAISIYNASGTGSLSIAYARLWLYDLVSGFWFPAGIGTDANKGKLNGGAAMGATATDQLRHREVLAYPALADRVAIELNTVAGTSPAMNCDVFLPRFVKR